MHYKSDIILRLMLLTGSFVSSSAKSTASEVTTRSSQSTTLFHPVATTRRVETETTIKSRYEQGLEDYDEAMANARQSRGMSMDYHHDHEEMKEEKKAVASDPWASYYDFVINEWSFKFWSVFQLFTALLLIYSAAAAAYYAKFNVITTDYDYYDDYFGRSNNDPPSSNLWSGLSSSTFQRILDAISSKEYT